MKKLLSFFAFFVLLFSGGLLLASCGKDGGGDRDATTYSHKPLRLWDR